MDFKYFDSLYMETAFDEIKVIGRDVELDGHYAHIIGMTLKDRHVFIYVLEMMEHNDTEENFQNCTDITHRQQMINNCINDRNIAFLRIREFHSNGNVYAVAGASSSTTDNYNMAEHMLFYLKMKEHGWKISEDSLLYTADWKHLQLAVIELRDEMEELPDWETDLEIVKDSYPRNEILEIPVLLTCGEHPVISFPLSDGTQVKCYINKICLKDVWKDFEYRFENEEYRNRLLKHVSLEEFQKMKQHYEEALLVCCPRGKCYMLIEYECSTDVAINFYAASYLNSKQQIHSGSATSLLIMHHPDTEEGVHGLKLRGCVIQTPLTLDEISLEAELFSCTEIVKQYIKKIY